MLKEGIWADEVESGRLRPFPASASITKEVNLLKILVIIPCYNEQDNILQTVRQLQTDCPEADYLVVNDCSTDQSLEVLRKNGLHHINLPCNLGIGGGVQAGYMYARENGYDITVQMDGDGQHDPAYLRAVIAPVQAGEADMCIGSRFLEKKGFQTSFARRAGIRFLSVLIRLLTGSRVLDVTSGYRACGKRLTAFYADHYAQDYPEPEAIVAAVLGGFTVREVPVEMKERQGGVSSIRAFSSIYYMIKVSLALIVYRMTVSRKKGER